MKNFPVELPDNESREGKGKRVRMRQREALLFVGL